MVLVAAWLGLTEVLGAHPFWAIAVAVYGVVPGLISWAVLRRTRAGLPIAIVMTIGSAAAAHFGKAAFAASYAESVWGGRFWFFGWIALCATVLVVLSLLIAAIMRRVTLA